MTLNTIDVGFLAHIFTLTGIERNMFTNVMMIVRLVFLL